MELLAKLLRKGRLHVLCKTYVYSNAWNQIPDHRRGVIHVTIESVAAVSAAGGIGVVQPISLTFVYKHQIPLWPALYLKPDTNPIGLNLLI